jgi:hypothetical protein
MAIARNKLIGGPLGAAVAIALAGCSQTCTSVAVIGHYTMRSGSDVYELVLAKDGTGSLSRKGVVESFTWEWWTESEQPFLHISSEASDDLMARAGTPPPHDVAKTRSGYLGLSPKCRSGSATELDIGLNGDLRFLRTDR